ncbi:hypothetical protein LSH36_346g03011 [Paralvinella palmiformis]|uniref:Uncharacterized protein n=1 Tax=Paralvinella palmiformis TaxID=53620 RepID=A0AAD9JFX3_9ANNE|nr:hypothetical protein LSH36_346g03011 [Paralvinella palmiformis]
MQASEQNGQKVQLIEHCTENLQALGSIHNVACVCRLVQPVIKCFSLGITFLHDGSETGNDADIKRPYSGLFFFAINPKEKQKSVHLDQVQQHLHLPPYLIGFDCLPIIRQVSLSVGEENIHMSGTVDCSQHSQGGATDLTTHISTVMDFVAVFVASINSLFYLFICHQPYQMTDVDSSLELFIATGRTGRRNALANIKDGEVCKTSTASLPFQLEKLQCSDNNESNKSDSASGSSAPSASDKNSDKTQNTQNDKTS